MNASKHQWFNCKCRPWTTWARLLQTTIPPHEGVKANKTIIALEGWLALHQYLPAKPIKWGLKRWALADSTSGDLHRFQVCVYTGQEEQQEKGHGHQVVSELTQHDFGTHISMYFDNIYKSTDLLKDLKCMWNHHLWNSSVKQEGAAKGLAPCQTEVVKAWVSSSTARWTYILCVWILSHSTSFQISMINWMLDQWGELLRQRQHGFPFLQDYQQHMQGMDIADQMVGYYLLNHQSRK